MYRLGLGLALSAAVAFPSALEMSRPVRTWEFLDATGQRSSILGREDGLLEAYVYPLKLFSSFQFSFELAGRVIPASAISRRVAFHPGSVDIVYTGDEFRVVETLLVPVREPGGLIRLQIEAQDELTVRFTFRPDFQLMWPASFGSGFGQWKPNERLFVMGADGQPYAAVLGGTELQLDSTDYATNYSAQSKAAFSLGSMKGMGERLIAFAASMKSVEEAEQVESRLLQNPAAIENQTAEYYAKYLDSTVSVDLPDKDLQSAYDWSRLSLVKGMVENPFLGKGLIAGYGPSKGSYRPGFAWFFGRDSFWSSFALNSEGDWENSREAIEFISRFQRADGKIPHEISQSAAQVAWAKDYPYEYASADATPLFIIAVRDYVEHSGDKAFASQMWNRVSRAMAFSRSTFDPDGFAKNFGVGHGWVEGGPLLPVRVEFYMAGCYLEAVRSFAQLARWTGHASEAGPLEKEADEKARNLNNLFWLASSGTYAFAIGNDGKPVDQPTVLALVPEWWSLLDLGRVQEMTEHLAEESHQSDWGMRIISSSAKLYSPAGYHFGSVWPLFTGWASVGEYHAHEAAPAFANLKANSWLTLDGANGNTTEVLSGETYSPLSTATPHQIWSAAMVISPLLRGLFGLEVNSIDKHVTLRPHFPAEWRKASLHHVRVGTGYADFSFRRTGQYLILGIENHSTGPWKLTFAPAYSPYTELTAVTMRGGPLTFSRQQNGTDWHPVIDAEVPASGTNIRLDSKGYFGVDIPALPPQLAETSSNLKLISEKWLDGNKRLQLTLSGLAGRTYRLPVTGFEYIGRIDGGEITGDSIRVSMPAGNGYVTSTVDIHFR